MAGDDDEVTMVANPYRAAVQRARQSSLAPAGRLAQALRQARTAMDNGAWIGGRADAFAAELDGHRGVVTGAGPEALAEFDAALARLPQIVESDSWYVRWQRMGPR